MKLAFISLVNVGLIRFLASANGTHLEVTVYDNRLHNTSGSFTIMHRSRGGVAGRFNHVQPKITYLTLTRKMYFLYACQVWQTGAHSNSVKEALTITVYRFKSVTTFRLKTGRYRVPISKSASS